MWESGVEREWVGGSILGETPSLRAGGRLRGVCQEPGHLENPAKVEEGEVGWYPGNFSVLKHGVAWGDV